MKYLLLIACVLLTACSEKPVDKQTVVGVIPYNGMSTDKAGRLKAVIEKYYGVQVKMLSSQALPKAAFVNIKSPRYRADSLIIFQQRVIPEGVDYVMGLTESDISTTKRDAEGNIKKPVWKYNDFGIMGLAYCPGKSSVVSGFRLKHQDTAVHFGRFKKVVIHELGHNFGLPHCPDKKCVMTDAVESIRTIDNANPGLCEECKKKIGKG